METLDRSVSSSPPSSEEEVDARSGLSSPLTSSRCCFRLLIFYFAFRYVCMILLLYFFTLSFFDGEMVIQLSVESKTTTQFIPLRGEGDVQSTSFR